MYFYLTLSQPSQLPPLRLEHSSSNARFQTVRQFLHHLLGLGEWHCGACWGTMGHRFKNLGLVKYYTFAILPRPWVLWVRACVCAWQGVNLQPLWTYEGIDNTICGQSPKTTFTQPSSIEQTTCRIVTVPSGASCVADLPSAAV